MSRRRKSSPELSSSLVAQSTALAVRGLRVADAAKYAGVSHWFIRTAVWQGKLRAYRAGKVIIVLRDDLDRWLNSLPEVQRNDAAWFANRQKAVRAFAEPGQQTAGTVVYTGHIVARQLGGVSR